MSGTQVPVLVHLHINTPQEARYRYTIEYGEIKFGKKFKTIFLNQLAPHKEIIVRIKTSNKQIRENKFTKLSFAPECIINITIPVRHISKK